MNQYDSEYLESFDSSNSFQHEHEISKETNFIEGPVINKQETKLKIQARNIYSEQNEDLVLSPRDLEIISDQIKNQVLSQFNSIQSEQKLPSGNVNHHNHSKQNRNHSDCSSILNESTNIKEVILNRHSQKRLLNKNQQDIELNMESLPSQQTLTITSPLTTKMNMILDLNLRLTNLKELSESLFVQNMFIRSIDIRNNRLTRIPDSICDLPHLWKIRMDYNYLTELPKHLGYISRLEYFSASQNKIQQLPNSITYLGTKVGVFQVNDNRLVDLPKDLGMLTEVRSLLLHNNLINKIPSSIYKMQKLNEFSMDWFQYHFKDRQIPKIQKDETGRLILMEFLRFLEIYDKIQQDKKDQQVSFMHYLMYFHKLHKASQIQDIIFPKKRSIFHLLALNGALYLFEELYKLIQNICKVDINQLDEEDSTPLLLAIKNKRKDFVKFLLTIPQVQINKGSFKYGYPLHLLILTHDFKLALKFIVSDQEENFKYLDINVKNEEGNNSMHYLFMNFSVNPQQAKNIAIQLIKRGVNINALNKSELSPLHLAIIGNNYEAIEFTLNHNTLMRQGSGIESYKLSFSKQKFNFNLQGGKVNQSCLHMAIQQNNIKTIMVLLQSKELLNHLQSDDEGRIPKDTCPYNSPIYKLLMQYEKKHNSMILPINEDINEFLEPQVAVTHLNVNRRFRESPTTNKKRQNSLANFSNYHSQNKNLRTAQSTNNLNFASKLRQNSKSNYETQQNFKNQNIFGCDKSKEISHNRVLSGDKYQKLLSSLNDESNNGVDEFSNMDFQTTNNKMSSQNLIQNLQRNILGITKDNKKNISKPFYQEIRSDTLLLNKKTLQQNQNFVYIKSNISSPDDSFYQALKPVDCQIFSEETKMDFIQHQPFKLGIPETEKYPKLNIDSMIIQNAIRLENQDEEDEANIPEEVNDQSDHNQMESKPPIRILQKAQTATGNQLQKISSYKQASQIKQIIDEVERCRTIGNQVVEQQIYVNNQAIRLSHFSLCNTLHQSKQYSQNQEQGNEVHELSQISIVNDETIGIQVPQVEQLSPRFCQNQREFNNFKTNLKEDIFKVNSTIADQTKSKNKSSYEVMILSIIRKDPQIFELLVKSTQKLDFINSNEITLFLDTLYYACQILTLREIQDLLQITFKSKILTLYCQDSKQISKKVRELMIFEMINSHQIKIYDQKKSLQHQIKLLDDQKLIVDSVQFESDSIQKLKHFHKSPSFKSQNQKSPTCITISDVDQNPNVSPIRKFMVKDYSSTQNLFHPTTDLKIQNTVYSKFNMSRKSHAISDLRNSVKGHRDQHQIRQPCQGKIEYYNSNEKMLDSNNESILIEMIPSRSLRINLDTSKPQSKSIMNNEHEIKPYQPRLSNSLFIQNIEKQQKKLQENVQNSHLYKSTLQKFNRLQITSPNHPKMFQGNRDKHGDTYGHNSMQFITNNNSLESSRVVNCFQEEPVISRNTNQDLSHPKKPVVKKMYISENKTKSQRNLDVRQNFNAVHMFASPPKQQNLELIQYNVKSNKSKTFSKPKIQADSNQVKNRKASKELTSNRINTIQKSAIQLKNIFTGSNNKQNVNQKVTSKQPQYNTNDQINSKTKRKFDTIQEFHQSERKQGYQPLSPRLQFKARTDRKFSAYLVSDVDNINGNTIS